MDLLKLKNCKAGIKKIKFKFLDVNLLIKNLHLRQINMFVMWKFVKLKLNELILNIRSNRYYLRDSVADIIVNPISAKVINSQNEEKLHI